MATVTTSTNSNPILYPGSTRLDVYPADRSLWVLSLNNSGNIELSKSVNNGGSWSVVNTLVRANLQEVTMYIPAAAPEVHVAYRTNESSQDRVYHRVYYMNSNTWSAELQVAFSGNGGVAGSILTGLDLVVVGANGQEFIPIAVGIQGGGTFGAILVGAVVPSAGAAPQSAPNLFNGPVSYRHSGSGRVGPSLDIEHIGDGKTATTPHLWFTFGRTRINMMSCGWTGWGWVTPGSAYNMVDPVPAQDSIRGVFDGRRYLAASINNANTSTVAVWERNRSNTGATTLRQTPVHPAGVVRSCTIGYDYSQDDFRVFAIGTSNNDLYYTTYDRSAGTSSAWSAVTTTDVLGVPPGNYSAKRATYYNARFDALIAHSGSPNTIVHYPVTQAYAPGTPVWALPENGSPQDVAAAMVLDWTFVDVDPNDTQSAYALSRQIGTDALEYWQASTGTWQSTEQKNTSGTTQVTLPTGFVDRFDAGVVGAWTPSNSTFVATTAQSRSGGKAALLTSVGTPIVASAHYVEFPVTALASYSAELWGLSIGGYGAFLVTINWYTAGHVYISTSSGVSSALTAGVWGRRSLTATAPATAAFATVGPTIGTNPPNGTAVYVDDVSFGSTLTPWGAGTDSAHAYRVKVWDSTDIASGYSAALTVVPSAKANPTITAPTPAQVIAGDSLTVTWTVTEQTAWRVRLFAQPSGLVVHDSGWMSTALTSYVVPYSMADASSWTVGVTTKNLEGLSSNEIYQGFTTDFVEPALPTLAFTPTPASGYIRVVITNPAPSGGQPSVASQELWRRTIGDTSDGTRVATALVNNATYDDWRAVGLVAYEYRTRTRGVNGTSVYSTWQS